MIYNDFYPTKVAINGANGRLGSELLKLKWNLDVVGWTRKDADLSKENEVEKLVSSEMPDIIIHTASATDLVKCENDRQYSWKNIVLPTINIVKQCNRWGIKLAHISSNYVFSGEEPIKPIPIETAPNPLNVYGFGKSVSEAVVMTLKNYAIIRLSVKDKGPWKHDKAPTDMWQTICHYDEAAEYIQKVVMNDEKGIMHFGTKNINVFEYAKSTKPDVQPITRNQIKTLKLPGDIRLKHD